MINVDALFKVFFVRALDVTGEGIPGVLVKVYHLITGEDVTAQLTGTANPTTNNQGVVTKYLPNPVMPGGVYKITLTKRGWQGLETATNEGAGGVISFLGYGFYTLNMVKQQTAGEADYQVAVPPLFVSPMYPVTFEIDAEIVEENERLVTSVSPLHGANSEIITDTDADGGAVIDIHNRIRLKPLPLQVPSNVVSIDDTYFSDSITVGVKALTVDGFLTIPLNVESSDVPELELLAANMRPLYFENDLKDYVPATGQLSKWIVNDSELTCFVGYLMDVMLWLPIEQEYKLNIIYYNSIGMELDNKFFDLTASKYVKRVRVEENPENGADYCTMQVVDAAGVEVTELLKIVYQYGN